MAMILKSFYIHQDEWETVKAKAKGNGLTISFVIRELLRLWISGKLDNFEFEIKRQ